MLAKPPPTATTSAAPTTTPTTPASATNTTAGDKPQFPPCDGVQVSMSVTTNRATSDGKLGSMIAEVEWANRKGPDCSYKGYPGVVFTVGDSEHELPTTATRQDDFPERWVNFTWNPDDNRDNPGDGHFRVYSTSLDRDGRPCPPGHMEAPDYLKVTLPGIGEFQVLVEPIYEGPKVTSCDGRIAVTPVAQAKLR
jgi:hypothetical protein